MKNVKSVGAAIILLAFAALSIKHYLGYHYYYEYTAGRRQGGKIEVSFPELEGKLTKAIHFNSNPMFLAALSELYFEMASAENESGMSEKRDDYLDLARETLSRRIRNNPIDAFAYYDLGRVYLLYNFPLLLYGEKGRAFFRRALELSPGDEFINVNSIYIFLAQWDSLSSIEKDFVGAKFKDILKYNASFIPRIRDMWKENFGSMDKLNEILSKSVLWPQLEKYF